MFNAKISIPQAHNIYFALQPLTVVKITQPRAPMNLISKRTQKLRTEEMTKARAILSAGSPSIVLLATEMRSLAQEERDELLKTAAEMKPEQGLALKVGLGLPWNKLRLL